MFSFLKCNLCTSRLYPVTMGPGNSGAFNFSIFGIVTFYVCSIHCFYECNLCTSHLYPLLLWVPGIASLKNLCLYSRGGVMDSVFA